jgi:hypothetical protein
MKLSSALIALAFATGSLLSTPPASASSPGRVSVEFRGPLKDALKKIASQGGLNLVSIGDLSEPADVHLKDVAPEEALETVASSYQLKIERKGSIWTIRRMTEEEKLSLAPPAPTPSLPAMPPLPATPAQPGSGESAAQSSGAEAEADKAAREAEQEITQGNEQHGTPIDRTELRRKLKQVAKKYKYRRMSKDSNNRVGQGSVVVGEGETVRDAVAYGGDLTVNGELTGDAVAIGGRVLVNGHVAGSAIAIGGGVQLGPHASIDKDVVSIGGQVEKEEGAEIGGDQLSGDVGKWASGMIADIVRQARDREQKDQDSSRHAHHPTSHISLGIPLFLLHFAVLFGLGFLFMIFAPGRMRQIESELKSEPLKCGLTGFVGLLAMVPLTLLLGITIIGLLLVPVLWVLAAVGITMGIAALANEIGSRLPFPATKTQALVLAFGTLVLLVVWRVPFLGPLVMCFIVLLSFGAIIRTRFGQRPKGIPEPV